MVHKKNSLFFIEFKSRQRERNIEYLHYKINYQNVFSSSVLLNRLSSKGGQFCPPKGDKKNKPRM